MVVRTQQPNRIWIKSILFGVISLFLVVSLVMYPEAAFNSSLEGLKIWWEVVFPALLPFFVASEILMGFGVVHFLGVLLEPFMRPIFRVPGPGGFVMAMGLASGYPIGAKLTARLREQKLITRSEGERLVSFTNTADPLFMFGAVAVGFFHDVRLGMIIAIAHYISSLLVGFIMRFHDRHGESTPKTQHSREFFLIRAIKAMHHARLQDGRKLGTLMGDAIINSVNTLLMVGGYIMIFSVIIQVLTIMNVTSLFANAIALVLVPFGIAGDLAHSVIAGFFEIDLGAKSASEFRNSLPIGQVIAVVSAIIAWSGLCVHAQVASILSKTNIRYAPYMFARILHAIFAGVVTVLLWNPVNRWMSTSGSAIPAFFQQVPENSLLNMWSRVQFIGTRVLILLFILIGIAILIHLLQMYNHRKRR